MKKNIWVTGKQGQLASEIFNISCNSLGNFYFTSLKEIDIFLAYHYLKRGSPIRVHQQKKL